MPASSPAPDGPALPDVQAVRAYRNAGQDILIGAGLGAIIGNFAGGTIAGAMLKSPWWFGKPFLPAKEIGMPVYSMVPVLVTAIKHSASPGAMDAVLMATGVFAACTVPLLIAGLRKAKKARDRILRSDIHGSAHWATRAEIERAGLLPPTGKKAADNKHVCYVGGWIDPKTKKQVYLQHSGPEHIIVHAPTRSGKGVGLVIPTLLSWQGSVLVHDIKGENHALTAGWRASIGQRILRFSPTEPWRSCRFNPLDEIRVGSEREVSDVQNIATMIVDPDGKGLNDHWAKTGYALLVGTILHVLYCREIKEKTLAAVGSLLTTPPTEDDDEESDGPNMSGVDAVFKQMIEYDHRPPENLRLVTPAGEKTNTHKVIAESAQEMLNKAANEKSGVISTAMSFLSLYRDPLVAETISRSDFHIPDLMNADRPISLYLVVPPADKDRLKPLIRLILNQVVRRLSEKMEFEGGRSVASYKHRLLMMIDEFPSLGKLDVFEEALAFVAGYGLKAYLICQDTAQLHKAYTQNESITSNAHIRVYYAPNRIETAKHISEQLGKFTVTTESHSVSYGGGQLMPYQTGMSGAIQHQARELMTPDEVMRLRGPDKDGAGNITRPGAMIVVSAGHAPISGTQILYFRDPVFSRRSKIAAPLNGDHVAPEFLVAGNSDNSGNLTKNTDGTGDAEKIPAAEIVARNNSGNSAEIIPENHSSDDDRSVSLGTRADAPASVIENADTPSVLEPSEAEIDQAEVEAAGIDPSDIDDLPPEIAEVVGPADVAADDLPPAFEPGGPDDPASYPPPAPASGEGDEHEMSPAAMMDDAAEAAGRILRRRLTESSETFRKTDDARHRVLDKQGIGGLI